MKLSEEGSGDTSLMGRVDGGTIVHVQYIIIIVIYVDTKISSIIIILDIAMQGF